MIYKGRPISFLTQALRASSGRNNSGVITIRSRGGAHKRRFRIVDFFRNMVDIVGRVVRLEYDPVRTAYLALVVYRNGFLSYILAPEGLREGHCLSSGLSSSYNPGDAKTFRDISIGYNVNSVESVPFAGGNFGRSAGACVKLSRKQAGYVYSRMPSGEIRLVPDSSNSTIGIVSNGDAKFSFLSKAGDTRHVGRRPVVRGVAKNPVDHPHGGGQGKTKGGRCSVSPWGRLTKGKTTRSPRKSTVLIVKSRRS